MIVHPFPQGSTAWHHARLGIPTASAFDRILTPAKLELSKQAEGYIDELLVEWLTGEPQDMVSSQYMERGTELEDRARTSYELHTGLDVRTCGLITDDEGTVGCSVDGLVDDNGLVEIKIPGMKGQIAAKRHGTTRAKLQVQGQLWLTGRAWCDLFLWSPVKGLWIDPIRQHRDEAVIAAIDSALDAFRCDLHNAKTLAMAWGCVPAPAFDPDAWTPEGTRNVSDADIDAAVARIEAFRAGGNVR